MSVYFAQAGAYIKIGYSRNPFARVDTITWSGTRPSDLPRRAPAELIGWIPGDTWTEGAMHARFIADRVAGEWFYLDPEDAHQAIWDDPAGIDVHRMSAMAVFAAHNTPGITRAELAQVGVPIKSLPLEDAVEMPALVRALARQERAA